MDDVVEVVEQLEQKIKKLMTKSTDLEQENQSLRAELTFYQKRFQQLENEMNNSEKQLETLKTANALLGSDDFKRETKTKINSIIREIDYCIAQLAG